MGMVVSHSMSLAFQISTSVSWVLTTAPLMLSVTTWTEALSAPVSLASLEMASPVKV